MESIGSKFKEEREKKELSLEQIARDTKISKKYIAGLEEENFSIFPGDTYLIGFIRTYSEYLGLNPVEMITLYKNLKIQEQPPPMEELLEKKSNMPIVFMAGGAALVVILIVTGYFIANNVNFNSSMVTADSSDQIENSDELVEKTNDSEDKENDDSKETSADNPSIFRLSGNALDRRFIATDQILVTIQKKEYSIVFKKIDDMVTLNIPSGKQVLKIGDVAKVDLNNDSNNDVYIEIYDIDKNAIIINAQVRFKRITDSTDDNSSEETDGETQIASASEIGSSNIPERKQNNSLILRSDNKKSFILNGTFRGGCLFRTLIDGQERVERYYSKGETIQLNIDKEVRIWVANAGFIKLDIDGYNVAMGRNGEVAAKLIKWIKNGESGLFELQCVPMY